MKLQHLVKLLLGKKERSKIQILFFEGKEFNSFISITIIDDNNNVPIFHCFVKFSIIFVYFLYSVCPWLV
jgi:hypothetical protein